MVASAGDCPDLVQGSARAEVVTIDHRLHPERPKSDAELRKGKEQGDASELLFGQHARQQNTPDGKSDTAGRKHDRRPQSRRPEETLQGFSNTDCRCAPSSG